MTLIVSPAVDGQLVALSGNIARDNPQAAARFLDAVEAEFNFILDWPEASPVARLKKKNLRNIRYRPVKRPFQNYIVFYRATATTVFVGAVLWGGTNWQEDLEVF